MKLKDEFVITDLGESSVLVPVGEMAESLHGIIQLNETAAFIVKQMKDDITIDQIVDALIREYEVERDEAEKSVLAVVEKLNEMGGIDNLAYNGNRKA